MNLITLNNLTVNLAGREIFRELSWAINQGDRVGLIGPNGAGKTTLFKALVGEVTPHSGTITRYPHFSLGYLPQTLSFEAGRSLLEIAVHMPAKLADVEQQLGSHRLGPQRRDAGYRRAVQGSVRLPATLPRHEH